MIEKDLVTVEELQEETRKAFPGKEESFYDGSKGFPFDVCYKVLCKKFKSFSSLRLCLSAMSGKVDELDKLMKEVKEYLRIKEFDMDSLIDEGLKNESMKSQPAHLYKDFFADKERLVANKEIIFSEITLFIYEIYNTHVKDEYQDDPESDYYYYTNFIREFMIKLNTESEIRNKLLALTNMKSRLVEYFESIYLKLNEILYWNNQLPKQLDLAKKNVHKPILEINYMNKFLTNDMNNLAQFKRNKLFDIGYILHVRHHGAPENTHAVCVLMLYPPTEGGVQVYVFIDSNSKTLLTFATQEKLKEYLVATYATIYNQYVMVSKNAINSEQEVNLSERKYFSFLNRVNKIMTSMLSEKSEEKEEDNEELYGGKTYYTLP